MVTPAQLKKLNDVVPHLKKGDTILLVCVIINFIWPGIGTIIGAIKGKKKEKTKMIVVGILQFVLAYVLCIGWIWSAVWAYFMWQRAKIPI